MNTTPWTFLMEICKDLKPKWIKLIYKEQALKMYGNKNWIKK